MPWISVVDFVYNAWRSCGDILAQTQVVNHDTCVDVLLEKKKNASFSLNSVYGFRDFDPLTL